jgi:hypothetical protein
MRGWRREATTEGGGRAITSPAELEVPAARLLPRPPLSFEQGSWLFREESGKKVNRRKRREEGEKNAPAGTAAAGE